MKDERKEVKKRWVDGWMDNIFNQQIWKIHWFILSQLDVFWRLVGHSPFYKDPQEGRKQDFILPLFRLHFSLTK